MLLVLSHFIRLTNFYVNVVIAVIGLKDIM